MRRSYKKVWHEVPVLLTVDDYEWLSTHLKRHSTVELLVGHIIAGYRKQCLQKPPRFKPQTRNCARCGRTFQTKVPRQRYCESRDINPDGCGALAFKESRPAYFAAYRQRNRDRLSIENAQYRLVNPAAIKRKNDRYRERHPDRVQQIARTNYVRRYTAHREKMIAQVRTKQKHLAQLGSFTLEQWKELKDTYGNCCVMCGVSESDKKLTVDHIIPLSMGGTNQLSNIQPLCMSCNAKKNDRPWFPYRPVDKSWPIEKTPMIWPVVEFSILPHNISRGN